MILLIGVLLLVAARVLWKHDDTSQFLIWLGGGLIWVAISLGLGIPQ